MKKTVLTLAVLLLAGCGAAPTVPNSDKIGEAVNKAVEEVKKGGDTATIPDTNNPVDTATCITGCSMLTGEGFLSKEFCEQSCYVAEAEETKNTSLCETKVQDELLKTGCYTAVAKGALDVTICDKIGNNMSDLMRGGCYTAVAEEKKDASVCEPIKDSLMYMGCVEAAKGTE